MDIKKCDTNFAANLAKASTGFLSKVLPSLQAQNEDKQDDIMILNTFYSKFKKKKEKIELNKEKYIKENLIVENKKKQLHYEKINREKVSKFKNEKELSKFLLMTSLNNAVIKIKSKSKNKQLNRKNNVTNGFLKTESGEIKIIEPDNNRNKSKKYLRHYKTQKSLNKSSPKALTPSPKINMPKKEKIGGKDIIEYLIQQKKIKIIDKINRRKQLEELERLVTERNFIKKELPKIRDPKTLEMITYRVFKLNSIIKKYMTKRDNEFEDDIEENKKNSSILKNKTITIDDETILFDEVDMRINEQFEKDYKIGKIIHEFEVQDQNEQLEKINNRRCKESVKPIVDVEKYHFNRTNKKVNDKKLFIPSSDLKKSCLFDKSFRPRGFRKSSFSKKLLDINLKKNKEQNQRFSSMSLNSLKSSTSTKNLKSKYLKKDFSSQNKNKAKDSSFEIERLEAEKERERTDFINNLQGSLNQLSIGKYDITKSCLKKTRKSYEIASFISKNLKNNKNNINIKSIDTQKEAIQKIDKPTDIVNSIFKTEVEISDKLGPTKNIGKSISFKKTATVNTFVSNNITNNKMQSNNNTNKFINENLDSQINENPNSIQTTNEEAKKNKKSSYFYNPARQTMLNTYSNLKTSVLTSDQIIPKNNINNISKQKSKHSKSKSKKSIFSYKSQEDSNDSLNHLNLIKDEEEVKFLNTSNNLLDNNNKNKAKSEIIEKTDWVSVQNNLEKLREKMFVITSDKKKIENQIKKTKFEKEQKQADIERKKRDKDIVKLAKQIYKDDEYTIPEIKQSNYDYIVSYLHKIDYKSRKLIENIFRKQRTYDKLMCTELRDQLTDYERKMDILKFNSEVKQLALTSMMIKNQKNLLFDREILEEIKEAEKLNHWSFTEFFQWQINKQKIFHVVGYNKRIKKTK